MVCYTVLLGATAVTYLARKFSGKKYAQGFWLNIMLLGGALFGVIDHAWHGELFLLGPSLGTDLALGGVITGGIFAGWGTIVYKERLTELLRLNVFKK
jgi:hypothetical protein